MLTTDSGLSGVLLMVELRWRQSGLLDPLYLFPPVLPVILPLQIWCLSQGHESTANVSR